MKNKRASLDDVPVRYQMQDCLHDLTLHLISHKNPFGRCENGGLRHNVIYSKLYQLLRISRKLEM